MQLWLDVSLVHEGGVVYRQKKVGGTQHPLVHGTVMSAATVGGQAAQVARTTGQAFSSDVRDTCASNRHFLLEQKKRKKSLNIVTLPL